jgi:hypothetical protein
MLEVLALEGTWAKTFASKIQRTEKFTWAKDSRKARRNSSVVRDIFGNFLLREGGTVVCIGTDVRSCLRLRKVSWTDVRRAEPILVWNQFEIGEALRVRGTTVKKVTVVQKLVSAWCQVHRLRSACSQHLLLQDVCSNNGYMCVPIPVGRGIARFIPYLWCVFQRFESFYE